MSEPDKTSPNDLMLMLGCGVLRRNEDGNICPLSVSEVKSCTNAQKLKMMTTMYGIARSMKKTDSVSQEEYDAKLHRAQVLIGKLTAQTLNDLTASRR